MTKTYSDPDWIRVAKPDITQALEALAVWEKDRIRFGFYPGSVGIVATGDPAQPWAIEISQRLFAKSFAEVW
jgi:hypothetical protein